MPALRRASLASAAASAWARQTFDKGALTFAFWILDAGQRFFVKLRELVRPAVSSAASWWIVGLSIGTLERFFTRSSTTPGSASVEVSPRLPMSFSAILRRMRRMILPSGSWAGRARTG